MGPLIMCSGFEVSAKPCMDEMGVDRSRRVEASVSTKRGQSARGYRRASIGRPSRARRVDVARARLAPSWSSSSLSSSRRGATRTHREDESPVGHRAPKVRRLRSRGTVDERAKRHGVVEREGRRALPMVMVKNFFFFFFVTRRRTDALDGDARDRSRIERTRDREMERRGRRRRRFGSRMRRRRGARARRECLFAQMQKFCR